MIERDLCKTYNEGTIEVSFYAASWGLSAGYPHDWRLRWYTAGDLCSTESSLLKIESCLFHVG
jgi:hypothetical protein